MSAPGGSGSLQRIARWIAGLAGFAALLLALGIGAFRLAIDLLPGYQHRVVERVREATGLRLEFDAVRARIGRYGPEVVFEGARVLPASGDEPLVSADAGRVSLAIARSIRYRRLEIARVIFVRPRLRFVITPDGRVSLVGQAALQQSTDDRPPMTLDRVPRGHFAVTDAVLEVLDLRAKQGRFQLTDADLDLRRSGDEITLTGRVDLPDHLGSGIDIEVEAGGALADNRAVDWRLRIEAQRLELDGWAALLPESFRVPEEGHGSMQVAARGAGRDVYSLRLAPDFANLRFAGAAEPFTRLAADLRLQRDATTLSVEASGLEISRPGAAWRPGSLEASLVRQDGRIVSVAARADYLRLENLAALAGALLPGATRERIAALAPRGELTGIDLAVADIKGRRIPDVTGRMQFSNLGIAPSGNGAGFTGFDGRLEGRGSEGSIELATRDATLDWPQQWRAPVPVLRADAHAGWQRFGDGVRIWLDDVFADSGHGSARGKLRMLLRPGERPLIDVAATATDFDVTQLWRYLQVGRLSPKTVGWLDAAFRAGRVTAADVVITGPTRGFPYRAGEGLFRARGHVEGVNLHVAAGWPEVRDVEADFGFDGPALHAVASRGSFGGIPFTDAEVNSGDLREAIFAARAATRTDASQALRMLKGTPLAPSFGALFADLAGAGTVRADVALFLPIKDFGRRVITVMAELDGVTLRTRQLPAEASSVTGTLWVRNREIEAPALAGRFLGGPFDASVTTAAQQDGSLRTRIDARGSLQGALVAALAGMPVNAGLAGTAGWQGTLEVMRAADPKRPTRGSVRLSSDLRGLASALPEPFAKRAESVRPLALAATFGGESGSRIEGSLGSDVHALLQLRGAPGAAPIDRGIIVFGGTAPDSLPAGAGLWLAGRLDTASLTQVLDLQWNGPRGRPLHEWLAGADLAVARMEVLGFEFTNLNGRLRPGNRAWDVTVSGDGVAGRIVVPFTFPGEVPMVLDLDRLAPGTRVAGNRDRPDPDPRRLPAIHVDIRDFVYDARSFGHLRADLARGTAGMTLNRFTMEHPAFTAEGRGSWLMRDAAAESRLDFDVTTTDVKGFMAAMQLGTQVEAEQGRVSARLTWPGVPEARAIERASGHLEISADNGQLTSVEPGAGRVFGLMSLAHLKRRLSLDFDDLTGQGLAFDTLRGTFRLTDGDIYTDNLTLRGSAAEIGLAGHTNLKDRTYDQTAVVTGQLGASLGVAGALAGGPVVGAALLLFSQVFKEPLQGATRGYYRITGNWDDPQVRRIDAREMKDERRDAEGPS